MINIEQYMLRQLLNILIAAFIILVTGSSCSGKNQGKKEGNEALSSTDTAKIFFRELEHNFGRITEGEKVACIFTFENRGKGPLVLQSVTTSCGCTAPRYDTKPIAPGGTGTIEVVFNSTGYHGLQTKTVTVKSNAATPWVMLKIMAEINSDK
jgi:hypothetical protein